MSTRTLKSKASKNNYEFTKKLLQLSRRDLFFCLSCLRAIMQLLAQINHRLLSFIAKLYFSRRASTKAISTTKLCVLSRDSLYHRIIIENFAD